MNIGSRRLHSFAALSAVSAVLSGCASLEEVRRGYVDKIGTYPLTKRNEVEELDLAQLVIEHIGQGRKPQFQKCSLSDYSTKQANAAEEDATPGHRLDEALGCFATFAEANRERAERARNQIQERMLAASEQRCGDYKMYIQRTQSMSTFVSGSLTSLFAAAGAITKSVEGARTLAGFSGLSSAVGAEYNQAYFASLAAHVIVAGIDRQRARIYEQIYGNGQSQPIDKYPLQAAIKDAFRYHASCTMSSGLVEAQDAIRVADNPGLDALRRTVVKNKHLQELTQAKPDEVADVIDRWKDLLPPDRWLAGVPLTTLSRPPANDATQAVNLLGERLARATSEPADFKVDVEKLTKKKAKLFKADAAPSKLAAGYITQVGESGNTTRIELNKCKDPALATASKLIDLAATRAPMVAGKDRDKLDIEISYTKADQTKQVAAISTVSANLGRCIAEARGAMASIDQLADDAAQDAIDKVIKPLKAALAACTLAKAQSAGEACPPAAVAAKP